MPTGGQALQRTPMHPRPLAASSPSLRCGQPGGPAAQSSHLEADLWQGAREGEGTEALPLSRAARRQRSVHVSAEKGSLPAAAP